LDTPHFRAPLEIVPGELLRVLRFELVIERLRIMVVHEDDRGTRRELIDELEDLPVTLGRHETAYVDDVGVGFRSTGHWALHRSQEMMGGTANATCVAGRPQVTRRGCRRRPLRKLTVIRVSLLKRCFVNISFVPI